jgi:hypothetical protein
MTIEEIKAFLNANKEDVEVKAFLAELSPEHVLTTDEVETFLGTDDGKTLVQPKIDQAVTKAVKTRDKANADIMEGEVKKRVAAKILEMNPEKSPLELKVAELEEANKIEKAERAKDNLKRQLVEEAAKRQINPFFIEDYMPGSFEDGVLFLKKIEAYNKEITTATTNKLLGEGYKPGSGNEKSNQGQKIDMKKLTLQEAIQKEMDGSLDEEITA